MIWWVCGLCCLWLMTFLVCDVLRVTGMCGWVCLLLLGFVFWFVSCWCGFVWLVQCRLAVLGYVSGLGSC